MSEYEKEKFFEFFSFYYIHLFARDFVDTVISLYAVYPIRVSKLLNDNNDNLLILGPIFHLYQFDAIKTFSI